MSQSGSGETDASAEEIPAPAATAHRDADDADTGEFDWRGWALVAAIVVAFLVVPAAILFLPTARGFIQSLGLTVRDAYLVLPLVPAFGLALVAVWSAIHSRSD